MENFSMIDFNYFDVTITAIILILGIKGFIQGFIKEAFGLVGLVAGVYFAARLASEAASFIDTNFFPFRKPIPFKTYWFFSYSRSYLAKCHNPWFYFFKAHKSKWLRFS